ncbi:YwqI/YxiC family protein [Metabacillus halosaccharovorans]|uniref:YwqI/YxiC family protein n=1 Tax=Metabacillus halosaccharovorans TaxID=930124 RepID=UPI0034CE2517
MGEIKFQYHDIERVVKGMTGASASLDPSIPKDVVKNNQLDITKKIEEINKSLEQIMTNYQQLLAQNEAMVTSSVEAMKATDESLKTSMLLQGVAEVEK